MKNHKQMFLTEALASAAVITMLCGCASQKTVQQTESMLVATGFKTVAATTPEQESLLKTLPDDRLSAIRRMGKIYFVYPDRSRKVLYVGHNEQYLAYEAKAQAAGLQPGDWDAAWGDWDAQ